MDQWWEHCEHDNEPSASKTKILIALLTLILPASLKLYRNRMDGCGVDSSGIGYRSVGIYREYENKSLDITKYCSLFY
jgi:hypothetical protein